jgi:hypothetical protein
MPFHRAYSVRAFVEGKFKPVHANDGEEESDNE